MLADLMMKALTRERHVRLMGLKGLKTISPSRVEDDRIGKRPTGQHDTEITSGSEELRNSHEVAKW